MTDPAVRAVTPVTVALMILVEALALGRPHAQEPIADNSKAQTPSDVARLQVEHGAAVQLRAKGKVKLSLKKDAPMFPMPGGMTTVVLLRLPDYQGNYDLKIVSSRSDKLGPITEIFVPSGIYFDDGFREVAQWGEEELVRETWRVSRSVTFREWGSNLRYLLLYTRAEWLGLNLRLDLRSGSHGIPLPGKVGLFWGNPFNVVKLKRSLLGKIQVETKPVKRN